MNSSLYSITTNVQNNMILNKGLLEMGGLTIPSTIMANNKVEARERAEKGGLYFGVSFLSPLVLLPIWNKTFLKQQGISEKFSKDEANIMSLSKKYLSRDTKYMEKGIDKLKETLKDDNAKKGIDNILKKFNNKEVLRHKLIKANRNVLFADFLTTGAMLGSISWASNYLTKKKTGQDGFSAEYNMADKKYVEQKAQDYVKNKRKNILVESGIVGLTSLAVPAIAHKGMTSNATSKIGKFLKRNIGNFDYHKGIYMSRFLLAAITLSSDVPSILLSSRDKEERKYNTIKTAAVFTTFMGGDLILNNVAAKIIDKTAGTKLVNKDKIKTDSSLWKKITAPINSFNEIKEKLKDSPKLLKKTKRAGVAMFWGNFALLTGLLGFGIPFILNKMVKKKVQEDLANQKMTTKNIESHTPKLKDERGVFAKFHQP